MRERFDFEMAGGAGTGAADRGSGFVRSGALSSLVLVLPLLLCGLLFAAHWLRQGATGHAAACLVLLAFVLTGSASGRILAVAGLGGAALKWFEVAGALLRVRLHFEEPWGVGLGILVAVAALNLLTLALVVGDRGTAFFRRRKDTAAPEVAAFVLVAVILAPVALAMPGTFLLERLRPGLAPLQVVLAACHGALAAGLLCDRKAAPRARMILWLSFSVFFFAQFFLALVFFPGLHMTGEPHVPVPGVVPAGAAYRLAPGFMGVLFLVCVLLVGPAWCSHLCYFGSFDARAARAERKAPWRASAAKSGSGSLSGAAPGFLPGLAARVRNGGTKASVLWRSAILAGTVGTAVLLRALDAPIQLATALAVTLGLLIVPAALLSRASGRAVYCTRLCPLGLLAVLLGRLSIWRIRRSSACDATGASGTSGVNGIGGTCVACGACARICAYGAMEAPEKTQGRKTGPTETRTTTAGDEVREAPDPDDLRNSLRFSQPGISCTLCRDCLSVCPTGALSLTTVFAKRDAAGVTGAAGAFPAADAATAARPAQASGQDGRDRPSSWERVFVVLVAALHAVFFWTAMA